MALKNVFFELLKKSIKLFFLRLRVITRSQGFQELLISALYVVLRIMYYVFVNKFVFTIMAPIILENT